MTNFESLEDSFLKKSSEQLSTDYQEAQKRQQTLKSEQEPKEDEKYENKIKQKDIRVGLAALLEEKIKQSRDPNQIDKENTEEDTVFFSSSAIRYEDSVAIPNTEVDEDDIQRFLVLVMIMKMKTMMDMTLLQRLRCTRVISNLSAKRILYSGVSQTSSQWQTKQTMPVVSLQ